MGFALSWVAIKGKAAAEILRELQLRPTGVRGLEGESPFVGAMSNTGWYVVVIRGVETRVLGPAVLERLSADCELLTCEVEEHVMFSRATGWRNGRQLWVVTHRGDEGPVEVEEEGALPPEYAPIRDRLVETQESEGGAEADVDHLFDIPVVLVQTYVGYRHDEVSPAVEPNGFEVLESESATRESPSLLRRLLAKLRGS
jgi:hypothetical protein